MVVSNISNIFVLNNKIEQIMTKQVSNIKDLEITLDALYEAKQQVNIHLSDKPYLFSLILKDRRGIDCKLSSFGANLWMRTNKGLKYEKYKTLSSLQSAIKRQINQKVESDGDITFSLSNEVYTF